MSGGIPPPPHYLHDMKHFLAEMGTDAHSSWGMSCKEQPA
jgi:hypothetical protein